MIIIYNLDLVAYGICVFFMIMIMVLFVVKYKSKRITKNEMKCSIPLSMICIFITI